MLIRSGLADVVAVEAHSKVSDVLTLGAIEAFALDPVLNRPLRVPVEALAGLEMNAFLERTGLSEGHVAMVVAKNRTNALDNPRAAYPASLTAEEVDGSEPVAWPLRELRDRRARRTAASSSCSPPRSARATSPRRRCGSSASGGRARRRRSRAGCGASRTR